MFIQLKRFQDDLRELVFQCSDELIKLNINDKRVLKLQQKFLLNRMSRIMTMIDDAPDTILKKAGD